MAITTTILKRGNAGNFHVIFGKSVLSGGVTTGEVVVPLKDIFYFNFIEKTTAQKGAAVNEDFPLRDTNVTIHTETSNGTVYWVAMGI